MTFLLNTSVILTFDLVYIKSIRATNWSKYAQKFGSTDQQVLKFLKENRIICHLPYTGKDEVPFKLSLELGI